MQWIFAIAVFAIVRAAVQSKFAGRLGVCIRAQSGWLPTRKAVMAVHRARSAKPSGPAPWCGPPPASAWGNGL